MPFPVFFLSMILWLLCSGGEPGWEGQNHLRPNQDWAQPAGWQPGAGDQAARAQVRWLELRSGGSSSGLQAAGAQVRRLDSRSSDRRSLGQVAGAQTFGQLELRSVQLALRSDSCTSGQSGRPQFRQIDLRSGSWSLGLYACRRSSGKARRLELRSGSWSSVQGEY